MSRTLLIEDKIAESLKDINNHKGTYLVTFNHQYIEVLEVENIPTEMNSLRKGTQLTLFDVSGEQL